LTDQAWSIRDLLHGQNENRFLLDHRGKPRAGQDGQPIRTQDLLHLAPQKIQILFARTRFPAVGATCINSLCDWLINLHHFLNQSEGNNNEWWHASTRFLAVCASRIDSLCDWLKKNSRHFLNQSEGNSNEWWHTSTCFAAFKTSYTQCLDIFLKKHCLRLLCEY